MDYCQTCRRHLNGALVCPGCGTVVGETPAPFEGAGSPGTDLPPGHHPTGYPEASEPAPPRRVAGRPHPRAGGTPAHGIPGGAPPPGPAPDGHARPPAAPRDPSPTREVPAGHTAAGTTADGGFPHWPDDTAHHAPDQLVDTDDTTLDERDDPRPDTAGARSHTGSHRAVRRRGKGRRRADKHHARKVAIGSAIGLVLVGVVAVEVGDVVMREDTRPRGQERASATPTETLDSTSPSSSQTRPTTSAAPSTSDPEDHAGTSDGPEPPTPTSERPTATEDGTVSPGDGHTSEEPGPTSEPPGDTTPEQPESPPESSPTEDEDEEEDDDGSCWWIFCP